VPPLWPQVCINIILIYPISRICKSRICRHACFGISRDFSMPQVSTPSSPPWVRQSPRPWLCSSFRRCGDSRPRRGRWQMEKNSEDSHGDWHKICKMTSFHVFLIGKMMINN
jgi:hypothetical protein